MADRGFCLVAVHGGAGYHAPGTEPDLKTALRLRSLETLQAGSEALDAVERAIAVLEDDPCLNAGYGSNLTLDGAVECDASVMDGRTDDFGAVGAVAGVKHPISAARAVLNHARVPDPLGRIPPSLLVSGGAQAFARQNGVDCVPSEALICERALAEYNIWKERLVSSNRTNPCSVPSEHRRFRDIQDTVGAIAWDSTGNLAAGVSSGGLLLKYPGRVGEAAIWGAGCWAQQHVADGRTERGVACSVSGSGEYIVRELLARSICEEIMGPAEVDAHDVLFRALSRFQKHAQGRGEEEPIAGVLLIVKEDGGDGGEGEVHPRLWCAFTAHSMAIAYASSLELKPKALLLRRPTPKKEYPESQIYITALSFTR